VANIKVKRRKLHLGTFKDEKAAALAYDAGARSHHGAWAKLNFPDEDGPGLHQERNSSDAGGQKVGLAAAGHETLPHCL
jgi:hypothetical protein